MTVLNVELLQANAHGEVPVGGKSLTLLPLRAHDLMVTLVKGVRRRHGAFLHPLIKGLGSGAHSQKATGYGNRDLTEQHDGNAGASAPGAHFFCPRSLDKPSTQEPSGTPCNSEASYKQSSERPAIENYIKHLTWLQDRALKLRCTLCAVSVHAGFSSM